MRSKKAVTKVVMVIVLTLLFLLVMLFIATPAGAAIGEIVSKITSISWF